jgi:hypothetical protein
MEKPRRPNRPSPPALAQTPAHLDRCLRARSFGTTSRKTASYGHDTVCADGPRRARLRVFSACAGSAEGGDDCVSHYDPVASAPTWEGLKDAMLEYKERGRGASVRTQARGDDVGVGDQVPWASLTYSSGTADAWFKSTSGVPTRGPGVLAPGANASTDRHRRM